MTAPARAGKPTARKEAGGSNRAAAAATDRMTFNDNARLARLVGPFNQHLARIEQRTGATIHCRGNEIAISGPETTVWTVKTALGDLYDRVDAGGELTVADVDAAVRLAERPAVPAGGAAADGTTIHTRRRVVLPRSAGQAAYIEALRASPLVFGIGPAGTGKTYLAAAMAVASLIEGQVDRIVLSRPAVEAGERLGFLPGDLREKVDPYLRPLYDALYEMLPADVVARKLETGEIEIAPLAFMRGRTLSHAYIILDEAQNASPVQMKMFLTRLGEGSRMVVTGDLSQVDLPGGSDSGLADALLTLKDVPGILVQWFDERDVVRHELVSRIVQAYARREAAAR